MLRSYETCNSEGGTDVGSYDALGRAVSDVVPGEQICCIVVRLYYVYGCKVNVKDTVAVKNHKQQGWYINKTSFGEPLLMETTYHTLVITLKLRMILFLARQGPQIAQLMVIGTSSFAIMPIYCRSLCWPAMLELLG